MEPDNATRRFTCSYEFDGQTWAVDVWASTHEEAEMKLRAMAQGTVNGVVTDVIPVGDVADAVDFIPFAGGKCPTCGKSLDES